MSGKTAAIIIAGATVVICVGTYQADKERPEKERRAAIEDAESAKEGKVHIGMSADLCRQAWGPPLHVSSYTDKDGTYEKWTYRHGTNLLFSNGVLKIVERP